MASDADALGEKLKTAPPEAFHAALAGETLDRLEAMLEGVQRYRSHSYRRDVSDPKDIWREGSTRLLDHGSNQRGRNDPVVVFVPSLVNRHYVLDLSQRRSLVRWLASQGLHPLLVDWGYPGTLEQDFGLTDYIAGRLDRIITYAAKLAGERPITVVGYCMGGNLALAGAQRNRERVKALALLATPWDFHADQSNRTQGGLLAAMQPVLEKLIDQMGELPVDALQAIFLSLDPALGVRKFAQFRAMDPASDAAKDFIAMEDWLNDGVPLTAPVARETLIGWYANNAMAMGQWQVAGETINPANLDIPVLAAVPGADRIVPPASAIALANALPKCEILQPPSGHIGMVAGPRAPEGLWQPLRDWLLRQAGH